MSLFANYLFSVRVCIQLFAEYHPLLLVGGAKDLTTEKREIELPHANKHEQ